MSKPLRILHAPIVAANQQAELSRALNRLPGVESHYMIFGDAQEKRVVSSGIDFDLTIKKQNYFNYLVRALKQLKFFIKAAKYYDVFHFHSNRSILYPTTLDIAILRKMGKKIVMSYWGCDSRRRSIGLKFAHNICKVCPKTDCHEAFKERKIAYFAKMADLQIIHAPESFDYVPGATLVPILIDTNKWRPLKSKKNSNSDIIKIMHSVWNLSVRGDTKGTVEVKKAVETLQKEGYKVDFLFFDQKSNKEMPKLYAQADIVVEQLRIGWHGATALEAMACGKPVITYLRPDLIKYMPDIPIVSANPRTITDVLRKLVKDKKLREELGKKGRVYAVKHHDSQKIAQQMLEIYKNL